MALALHYHPLSSFCHKVLIALYELGLPFEPQLLNLGDAAVGDAYRQLWPTGKMPLLVDAGQVVPETSIIIEHLARKCAAAQRLLPADPQACLDVRLWDRLSDHYVMHPMQAIVADRIRAEADRDPIAVAHAQGQLAMAYGMFERQLAQREASWIAGDEFTMADCAAAPALFYATTLVPLAPGQARLAAYQARLVARPSVARTLEEARPFFQFYPYRENLPERFRQPA